jgi:hypothetical protein
VQLDIRILPEKLKDIAHERLLPYVNDPMFRNNGTLKDQNKNDCAIKSIIDWMHSSDNSQNLNNFFAYTFALDSQRKENLLDIAPEFEPYYKLWKNYVAKKLVVNKT